MSSAPSTIIAPNSPSGVVTEFVPPPSSQTSSGGHGVGEGEGCTPPVSYVPPPDCAGDASANAQTITNIPNSLFINDSPLVGVVENGGGYAAKAAHPNTVTDPDSAQLEAFLDREDFVSAYDLCRKRKMLAQSDAEGVLWAKESAVVAGIQGRHLEALDRLTDVYFAARRLSGRLRGKYENTLGLTLVETNRTSTALTHFQLAIVHHKQAGYLRGCAAVRHNAGRAYASRGEREKAFRYFTRALQWARSVNDYRLEREVLDSIFEYEMAGGVR